MKKSRAHAPLAAIVLVVSGAFLLTGCADRSDTPEDIKKAAEAKQECESAKGVFKMDAYRDYYCDLSTYPDKD